MGNQHPAQPGRGTVKGCDEEPFGASSAGKAFYAAALSLGNGVSRIPFRGSLLQMGWVAA